MKTFTHPAGNWLLSTRDYAFLFGLILTISTSVFGSEPNQQWVARYNGPGNGIDVARALAVNNSGNVYVTGESSGNGTGYDYATVKYNADGNQLWAARYNGPGNSSDEARGLAVDNSGNVYVTGDSTGSGTSYDYATIKYSPDGNELWVARYNGPGNSGEYAVALAIDSSGNVYVTGRSYGGSGTGNDYATIKYSPDGNQLWVARYNGPGNSYDDARAIAVDNLGNAYVTGWSPDSNMYSDYATIKYSPDGNQLWVARYNGPGNSYDDARAIAVDNSGNVYVTGYSTGSSTGNDYATVKYGPSGNQLWVARYNNDANSTDTAYDLAVDNFGNVYVTGYSVGIGTGNDYATIKYSPDGNQLWVARYDGPGNSGDIAEALAVDNSGNVYVTGSSTGSGTSYDYGTVKYGPNGNQLWVARYNGPGNISDCAYALSVNNSGNVYVTGYSWGSDTSGDYATIKYGYRIYVDASATGANNGTSWADAYKYLQNALWAAEPNYEIWVSQGTYRPDRDTSNPGGTGSRSATFQLINNVAIYGGFPTGGGLWSSRDPNSHKTILSGDIGVVDDNSDNSYNVVTGSNTNSTAILDGLTVTAGNANGSYPYNAGGGVYDYNGIPTLTNCTFIGNSASLGGGMYNNYSSPTLTNCKFSGNSADYYGGGMAVAGTSNVTLTDCNFSGNSATIYGNGMYTYGTCVINVSAGGNISTSDEFYLSQDSRIQGTGSIVIGLGGEMVVVENAVVDMSDPNDPYVTGTIQCDGLLKVKNNGQLKHADVNVTRQAGGYFGKFEVEDSAQATNLDIHTDGDRFMDVDPCTFTGTIANNRIYVTITEGQNGTPEGILELRGLDFPESPCGPNQVCEIGEEDMPDFNTFSWTLERLTVAAGAKVTLMDRFDSGNGFPEVLYVKDLVLGTDCNLNVGVEHLYYTNFSGDSNLIIREAQLGFSLNIIDCDSNEEFQSRVANNNYIDPVDPCLNRIQVERVVGLEPDPNGMMKMSNLKDAYGDMIFARAKAKFAGATEDEIRIQFDYLFNTPDPCAQIVVYLSDVPELGNLNDANYYIEVSRISNPTFPLPGSNGSGRFGNFDKYVSTGILDLTNATYVELVLLEPAGGGPLLKGLNKQKQLMESEEEQHASGFVNNLNAQVSCYGCGICLDLDSSCQVEPKDFLMVVSGTGSDNTPTCVDGSFNNDGYTDSYDTPSWDWILNDPDREDRCGAVPLSGGGSFSAMGFGKFGDFFNLLNLADLSDLLILGKRGSTDNAIKMKDRLYVFGSSFDYIRWLGLEPDDRCNIRIVRGAGDDLYRINSEDGILRLDTGEQIVPPGEIPYPGIEPRYSQPATIVIGIQGPDDDPYGRPVLDAAFDANYVYVVPVIVAPSGNVPYAAAAKIQLNPYRVVQLYDGPIILPNDNQLEYRNNLREIEIDGAGNVYVTNSDKMNSSDILWKFEPNDSNQRLDLDLCNPAVRAPTGLCVSSATNTLYIVSSLHGQTDPNWVVVQGFSTVTLLPVRAITVRGMHHVTGIIEDPLTGSLWVAGFKLNSNPYPMPFYDPYLAKVPLRVNDVNALYISDANDLAMPLSICWTGALPPPELCGGADLNGSNRVSLADLAILAKHWLEIDCVPPGNCEGADLEPPVFGDGDVDIRDLDILAEHWLDTNCQ